MSGSTRRSNTSPRRRNGRTRAAATGGSGGARTRARTTCAMWSSWARTTSPSTRSASRPPFWARASRGRRWMCSRPSTVSTGTAANSPPRRGVGCLWTPALEILPPDAWRWYLTANSPESSDTTFTWEQLTAAVNRDLADVLGNFVNRILKFCEARFGGVVPAGGEPGPLEAAVRRRRGKARRVDRAVRGHRDAQVGPGPARAVGAGQRISAGGRALDGDQDRSRAGGGDRAHGAQSGGLLYARVSAPVIPFAAEAIAGARGRALAAHLAGAGCAPRSSSASRRG